LLGVRPVLDLRDPADLSVGLHVDVGMVDDPDKRLIAIQSPHNMLLQQSHQPLERQSLTDIADPLNIAMDADIGQDIQVLQEICPM
jgi:hypothetical protein